MVPSVHLSKRPRGGSDDVLPLMPLENRGYDCTVCATITFFSRDERYRRPIYDIFPFKEEWKRGFDVFGVDYAASIRETLRKRVGERAIPKEGCIMLTSVIRAVMSTLLEHKILDLSRVFFFSEVDPNVKEALYGRAVTYEQCIVEQLTPFFLLHKNKLPLKVRNWEVVAVIIAVKLHFFTLVCQNGAWYRYDDGHKSSLPFREVKQWIRGTHRERASSWIAAFYERPPQNLFLKRVRLKSSENFGRHERRHSVHTFFGKVKA